MPSEGVRLGPAGVPELTLGWQVLEWQLEYLQQPDGPDAGGPWILTDEQVRFVLWWYAIDETGRWIYRRGTLRRMKGWGKDPFLASICLVEMLGPCRFDFFDAEGYPHAKPQPSAWIQIAATSITQTVNTMSVFPGMISDRLKTEYGLDIGKEKIFSAAGDKIEAVTSSPRALEGGRPTLVVPNETQHWLASNEGHAMMSVIARNLAKSRGGTARSLAITNAHSPGEDSVAERDWDAYEMILDGRSKATGFLYDSLEAPPGVDLADRDALRAGLIAARGDSVWLDVDRLIDEIYDPTTPPSVARRFYLNEITAAEDSWLSPQEWKDCRADDKLHDGDVVTLGFDGSVNDDSTALVACRLSDGLLSLLAIEERPDGPAGDEWRVDSMAIDAAVDEAMSRFRVIGFYADPPHWQDYIDRWNSRYGARMIVKATHPRPLEWWTSRPKAMITSLERFHDAVVAQELCHDGNDILRRHVTNAKRRINPMGITIAKEHPQSRRKIDAAMAAVLAYEARADAVAAGLDRNRFRKQKAWGF